MKINNKDWIKNNKIFVLVILAVILAAFISIFLEHIGENPFRKSLPLENPVRIYTSDTKNYCISNVSDTVLILDNNYRLIDTIQSGNEEDTFSHAAELTWNENGNIFVIDRNLIENGSFSEKERILKFSSDGKMESVLYEAKTLDENGKQFIGLKGLRVIDNAVCFS